MKRIKIVTLALGILTLCLIAFSGIAQAQSIKTGNAVNVPVGETVDSMLFIGGNSIDIAGTVNGDVYCAGQNITISGTVKGDVFCAGQNINISGNVDGGVRLAGQAVIVNGIIKNSATIASQTLSLGKDSIIGNDLAGAAQTATLDGVIGRDIAVSFMSLNINGTVNRNIIGNIENINVGSTGVVGGNISYSSNNSPVISDGGQIKGDVAITPVKEQPSVSPEAITRLVVITILYMFVTMLIVALVISLLMSKILAKTTNKAIKSPGRTVLIGIGSVIIAPILIVALLMSFIGMPLGLLTMLVWILILTISFPFAGYMVGQLILKNSNSSVLKTLTGVSLLMIVFLIPILGFFVMIAAHIFGVGMIIDNLTQNLFKSAEKTS